MRYVGNLRRFEAPGDWEDSGPGGARSQFQRGLARRSDSSSALAANSEFRQQR
jgi:hypothetical protein